MPANAFTLVVILGAVGLSAWLGWLDYVLLPALGIFVAITIYAAVRCMKSPAGAAGDGTGDD